MSLYHRDIGFPPNFRRPDQRIDLTYTRHARMTSEQRGIRELRCITLSRFDVIEIEVVGGRINKMVVRGTYDQDSDICLVICQNGNTWVVKTVWLNNVNDLHKTLDRSRYESVG